MSFTPTEAIDRLDPKKWASTPIETKLDLLHKIRENIWIYWEELAHSDTKMKNSRIWDELYTTPESLVATVVPLASNVTASIDLYDYILEHGKMPEANEITKINENIYDIFVYPRTTKDKILSATQKHILRVKWEPVQKNPISKEWGIIAVLWAGNYSSSLEMIKALFYDNCCVVHKPHHLNEETDVIREKILQPLVEYGAVSFISWPWSRELVKDTRLKKIYFTWGADTAQKIMSWTDTEFISECWGNNPCIIVPWDRPWTEKEMKHQAIQIVTIGKLNGWAVCGRVQTIVTSKHRPQREAFLKHLEDAIKEHTPSAGSYYPWSDETWETFKEAHPEWVILQPEWWTRKASDFMFIKGVSEDSFAVENEAFCQIMSEVPLDVPATAEEFLPYATTFCNTKLLWTLWCAVLVDPDTLKANKDIVDQAITDLEYGGISINTMPPFIFLSPYLTWGGNEEGKEFVSWNGNFGNALCFENVEKSILRDDFMSMGHMMNVNKHSMQNLSENMAHYSNTPSRWNLFKLLWWAIVGSFRGKDF